MEVTGASLIGREDHIGEAHFQARDARLGDALDPPIGNAPAHIVRQACTLAADCFDAFRALSADRRADFLDAIADELTALGDTVVAQADIETGLGEVRLRGELARTVGQLRLFAGATRGELWERPIFDPALPERSPLPRPDLRQRRIPIGPVAVFGASNFPLAFSVAGGDTASALAAGCPVVVKGHPAHPATAELVGRAIRRAIARCGVPEGVFSLLQGNHLELGAQLVTDPAIKAVAFTGSRSGGVTLMSLAAQRLEPIPVFAEMSSVNPVVLLPSALAMHGARLAEEFVQSLTLGTGQFCTNPGVILGIAGPALDRFMEQASAALARVSAQPMLTDAIRERFVHIASAWSIRPDIRPLGGRSQLAGRNVTGCLFVASASAFLADFELRHEIFGPSAVIVPCENAAEMRACLESLDGQLTATLQMEASDQALAVGLVPLLERKAGRLLVNGWPTGVEVCNAMVHGGPFPATADGRSTSVGTSAIERFLRPVCYQNFPKDLLPPILRR